MQHDDEWLQQRTYEAADVNTGDNLLMDTEAATKVAEEYHEYRVAETSLNYVDVVSPGMTHCINLFMNDHCIALVDNSETVERLKGLIPERKVWMAANTKEK